MRRSKAVFFSFKNGLNKREFALLLEGEWDVLKRVSGALGGEVVVSEWYIYEY